MVGFVCCRKAPYGGSTEAEKGVKGLVSECEDTGARVAAARVVYDVCN